MSMKRGERFRSRDRERISHLSHQRQLLFVGVALIFLLVFVLLGATITGQVYYYDYGSSGSGIGYGGYGWSYDFSSLYYQYGYLIDAFVFLLIFLGAGKIAFTKQFGEHARPLYIGIGLFLAFALLLWEDRTGIHLLERLGPVAVALALIIVLVALMVSAKRGLHLSGFKAFLFGLLLFLALLYGFRVFALEMYYGTLNFLYNIWHPLGSVVQTLTSVGSSNYRVTWGGGTVMVLFLGALGWLLWWLFKHGAHKKRGLPRLDWSE